MNERVGESVALASFLAHRSEDEVRMSQRIMMHLAGSRRPLVLGSGGAPLVCSKATPWAGVPFEVHRMQSVSDVGESGPIENEVGLLVIVEGSVDIVVRGKTRDIHFTSVAGTTSFLSGNDRRKILSITGNAEAVAVNVPREWFHRLSLDGAPPEFGRTPALPRDETMLALAKVMRREVAEGAPSGRLHAESLSMALLDYAMDRVASRPSVIRGGLSEQQQRRLKRHVAEHLNEELSVVELASLVGLSTRQFSVFFRRAFGASPHQYVIAQRVAEAARLLHDGESSVTEIAFRVGFCSQTHLSTAFRRVYGTTPLRYALQRRTTIS
ncbi:MAG TPA: AraC family transcriptional regulator [Polyangiaceae bacterium]|nr:AraC family transcriptional regulator [Polyangiaceae bacterium]